MTARWIEVDGEERIAIVVERREAPPVTISQRTAERWTGVDGRRFLESLPDYQAAGGEVTRVGKLRLANLSAWLRWLSERDRAERAAESDAALDPVALRCGLRVVRR